MARKKRVVPENPTFVNCPFKILIDNQEKIPYKFDNERSNSDNGYLPYKVETEVRWLKKLGDYSLDHLNEESLEKHGPMPRCIIERKSFSDFIGSFSDRDNFEERVARLCEEVEFGAIVVEAEWKTFFTEPLKYFDKNGIERESKYSITSIHRSVQSFQMEYKNVHWCFYPGRESAESATFQYLMRFWNHFKKHQLDRDRKKANYQAYHEGIKASRQQIPIDSNPYPRARRVGDLGDYWNRGYIDGIDLFSQKTNGKTKCSEPPTFPQEIFYSDFQRTPSGSQDSSESA